MPCHFNFSVNFNFKTAIFEVENIWILFSKCKILSFSTGEWLLYLDMKESKPACILNVSSNGLFHVFLTRHHQMLAVECDLLTWE